MYSTPVCQDNVEGISPGQVVLGLVKAVKGPVGGAWAHPEGEPAAMVGSQLHPDLDDLALGVCNCMAANTPQNMVYECDEDTRVCVCEWMQAQRHSAHAWWNEPNPASYRVTCGSLIRNPDSQGHVQSCKPDGNPKW
jgi:hypothetical protein